MFLFFYLFYYYYYYFFFLKRDINRNNNVNKRKTKINSTYILTLYVETNHWRVGPVVARSTEDQEVRGSTLA